MTGPKPGWSWDAREYLRELFLRMVREEMPSVYDSFARDVRPLAESLPRSADEPDDPAAEAAFEGAVARWRENHGLSDEKWAWVPASAMSAWFVLGPDTGDSDKGGGRAGTPEAVALEEARARRRDAERRRVAEAWLVADDPEWAEILPFVIDSWLPTLETRAEAGKRFEHAVRAYLNRIDARAKKSLVRIPEGRIDPETRATGQDQHLRWLVWRVVRPDRGARSNMSWERLAQRFGKKPTAIRRGVNQALSLLLDK